MGAARPPASLGPLLRPPSAAGNDRRTTGLAPERGVSLSCCQVFLGGLGQGLGLGWLVGGSGFEHGEDDVAAASGDADDGGVVAFAF